jgi:radical SAM superfamily enzyme YgiQ (UPF0313 family)
MNVLLLYPEFPITYTGFQYALAASGRKALMPPLGLITIAAMLPEECKPRLVDLNCDPLTDADIEWADVVFLSAMLSQKGKMFAAASRCRSLGKTIVMGGPFPTSCPDECVPWCDTLVLGEAEAVWETFSSDLVNHRLQARYASDDKPDVTKTPVPRFDLLNAGNYLTIPIQFSRGCPFQCEFCDIIVMFGRRPRTKTPEQMMLEFEAVKRTGHRGEVFIVDDNFIGNKKAAKEFLPRLAAWNNANRQIFELWTEASVDLADDPELLELMFAAGFRSVFLGIETPSPESLKETLKFQNLREPLHQSIEKVVAAGLAVTAGFIIGFDSDTEEIFDRQIEFISTAQIPYAMVALLFALDGTPLHERLKAAGRLREMHATANNFGDTNINTVMPRRTLLEGYRRVVATLYAPEQFFERGFQSLIRLKRPGSFREAVADTIRGVRRVIESPGTNRGRGSVLRRLASTISRSYRTTRSLPGDFRKESNRFLWRIVRVRPDQFYAAMKLVVFGRHLHRFTMDHVLPTVDEQLTLLERFPESPKHSVKAAG